MLQKRFSLSSTEVEYVEHSDALETIRWLCMELPQPRIRQKTLYSISGLQQVHGLAARGAAEYFTKRRHVDVKHYHVLSLVNQMYITTTAVLRYDVKTGLVTRESLLCNIFTAVSSAKIFVDTEAV